MGFESNWLNSGDTVRAHYGPREIYEVFSAGVNKTEGTVVELVADLTGDDASVALGTIPAGSLVLDAQLIVAEAITVGNADNDINIGTDGSAATNGIEVVTNVGSTTLAAGTYASATKNGTWGARLAAATAVAVEVEGTTASMAGGKARVVVRYLAPVGLNGV